MARKHRLCKRRLNAAELAAIRDGQAHCRRCNVRFEGVRAVDAASYTLLYHDGYADRSVRRRHTLTP